MTPVRVLAVAVALTVGTVVPAVAAPPRSAPTPSAGAVAAPTAAVPPGGFQAVPPQPAFTGSLESRAVAVVPVAATGHLPETVGLRAVLVDITINAPTGSGEVTLFPDAGVEPAHGQLAVTPGVGGHTMALVNVNTSGRLRVANRSTGTVNVALLVVGYVRSGNATRPGTIRTVLPTSVFDTAVPARGSTIVGVGGVAGVPTSGVAAVVLNVRLQATTDAVVRFARLGAPVPERGQLQVFAGDVQRAFVVAPVDGQGRFTVSSTGTASVRIGADVQGYVLAGRAVDAGSLSPSGSVTRVLETTLVGPTTTQVRVTGQGGIPAAGARLALVNVTLTGASAEVTVGPSGGPASVRVTVVAHAFVRTAVTVPIGQDGLIVVRAFGTAQVGVALDVVGWWLTGPDTIAPPTPAASAVGASAITVSWTVPPYWLGTTQVLRRPDSADGRPQTPVAAVPAGTYSWTDTGRPRTTRYAYALRATDVFGRVGPISAWVMATTLGGLAWSTPVQPFGADTITALACDAPSFCTATSSAGVLASWDGGDWSAWTRPAPPAPSGEVHCATRQSCFELDGAHRLWVFDGTVWSQRTTVPDGLTHSGCSGPTHCLAIDVDGYGSIYRQGTWSDVTQIVNTEGEHAPFVQDVLCSTGGLCVAIAGGIAAVSSVTPPAAAGAPAKAGVPRVVCTVGGCTSSDNQYWFLVSAAGGTARSLLPDRFATVSCGSSTWCWSGTRLWNGTSWSGSETPPSGAAFFTCPADGLCLAASEGSVSTGRS